MPRPLFLDAANRENDMGQMAELAHEMDDGDLDMCAYQQDLENLQREATEVIARLEREACITPNQASLLRWACGIQ